MKRIALLLAVLLLFAPFGCNSSPEGNTVAVVEYFDATWLMKSFIFDLPKLEISRDLGFNRVVYIAYYVDSSDKDAFPRLACKESEERMAWYMSDKGIPSYFFNGTNLMKGIPNIPDDSMKSKQKAIKDELLKRITAINQITPPVKITGQCYLLENKTYQIKIQVDVLDDIKYENLQIITALTESNIPYKALNRDIHDYVFREFLKPKDIKDTIGIPIKLAKKGETYKTEFTFDLNKELCKNELAIVFFVQDLIQKTILQGVIIPLLNH